MSQASAIRIVAPPGVFRPRGDTWMLASLIGKEVLPGSAVLDLCSGSGALAVAAARTGAGEVTAVDVSRRSTLAIRMNAAINRVRVRTLRGDLYLPVAGERFDLIVANPPYLPTPAGAAIPARGPARAWEGGPGGRCFVDLIVAGAPAHLRPGGTLLMVHSEVCGIERTLAACEQAGLPGGVALRDRGPVGPLLAARAPQLADEEIAVIRASLPREE